MWSKICEPWWDDKPVAIVACGTSLQGFDWDRLSRFHVLAVKSAMFDVPCEAGFGLDYPRYDEWLADGKFHGINFPVFWAFSEKYWSEHHHLRPPCIVPLLRRSHVNLLSGRDDMVCGGSSSGFGALNVAYLKRAKQIVLLGFDYDGIGHFNDDHYRIKRAMCPVNFRQWAYNFDGMLPQLRKAGVSVINASPASAITAFPKVEIDEALEHFHRLRSA